MSLRVVPKAPFLLDALFPCRLHATSYPRGVLQGPEQWWLLP